MTAGFYAVLDTTLYRSLTNRKIKDQTLRYWLGGPYTFCLSAYMRLVGDWLAENLPEEKRVSYVFESGHSRFKEANMFLQMVATDRDYNEIKESYQYGSHAFLNGKRKRGRILQVADIIAWHGVRNIITEKFDPDLNRVDVPTFSRIYIERSSIENSINDTLAQWSKKGKDGPRR